MKEWKSDAELFSLIREYLYTAVVGDVMDKMSYYCQFLPPSVKPINDDMVIVGRAMTVAESNFCGEGLVGNNAVLNKPFGLMLEALDNLKEDEVYICSGASPEFALVGELMATRAKFLKSAGMVVNGYCRDVRGILETGLPVFSYGAYAKDQAPRGRVIDYRVPIKIGDVFVNPGDLVFGDSEGVVVVPRKIEDEVIHMAYKKATDEKTVAKAIKSGMSATESFAKYGVM